MPDGICSLIMKTHLQKSRSRRLSPRQYLVSLYVATSDGSLSSSSGESVSECQKRVEYVRRIIEFAHIVCSLCDASKVIHVFMCSKGRIQVGGNSQTMSIFCV